MRTRLFASLALAATLAACATNAGPAAKPADAKPATDGWEPLFNGKNLDGFYTYLDKEGKNKDVNHIFKVEDGMIHIMDLAPSSDTQETGYLATEKSYGDYHLRLQYKWGAKRFAPRANMPRDSGVHYLLTGDDKVWANALECQIQEGESGDLYVLNNAYVVQTKVKSPTDRTKTYAADGTPAAAGSHLLRSQTVDSLTDWNTVDVIVKGNTSTHIVNGTITAHMDSINTRDGKPVTEGRIAFQDEAAEMWYRNIEIKMLK